MGGARSGHAPKGSQVVPHSLQSSHATLLLAVPQGEAGRVQPPAPPARSLGFPGALSAACAEEILALLPGGAGFARGVPAVFLALRSPGESSCSGPKMRACPPVSQLNFPLSSLSAGGEQA